VSATESPNLPTNTALAVDRTRLAHDRTLLAWVRTATSLISFGFTIYKFFQYLRQEENVPVRHLLGPREFAMAMIGIGLIALCIATAQHRREMVSLRKQFPEVPYSLATVLAGLIAILGVAAFLAAVFRQ